MLSEVLRAGCASTAGHSHLSTPDSILMCHVMLGMTAITPGTPGRPHLRFPHLGPAGACPRWSIKALGIQKPFQHGAGHYTDGPLFDEGGKDGVQQHACYL